MDVNLEDLLVSYLQCRSNKRNTEVDLDSMRKLVRMIALADPLDNVEIRGKPVLWRGFAIRISR